MTAPIAVLVGAAVMFWLLWRRSVRQERKVRARTIAVLPDEGWRPLPPDRQWLGAAPIDAVGGRDWRVRYVAADTTTGLDLLALSFSYAGDQDEGGMGSACTVVRLALPPAAALPDVTVRRYGPLTTAVLRLVPVRLPGTGIDLGEREFAVRFRTTAPDPAAAAALLTPAVRRVLLDDPRVAVRIADGHLTCWALWSGRLKHTDDGFTRDRAPLRAVAVRLLPLLTAAAGRDAP